MVETIIRPPQSSLVVRLAPALHLDDRQLFALCRLNRDLRIERTAEGDLEIMPPTAEETGSQNAALTTLLTTWSWQDGTGTAYDSSVGFRLPNGAVRSPDASWVLRSRLDVFSREARGRGFLPLCPDFVAELRSPSDTITELQDKMRAYMENGARIGWILDPPARRVYVYRVGASVQVLDDPAQVSADPELPGFTLELGKLWGAASAVETTPSEG
ncbi:MAG: Uma2 family endonuclease [Chloroflexota bacterium]|nr:Uma2 family endonuclease [Chloroflexota bacterium]